MNNERSRIETDDLIRCIPAVRRLSLLRIGPWHQAILDFVPGLNIITGEGGSGRTTILNSLAPSGSAVSCAMAGYQSGRVDIEYSCKRMLPRCAPSSGLSHKERYSPGQQLLFLLDHWINSLSRGCALVIREAVFDHLERTNLDCVLRRLLQSSFQSIMVCPMNRIPHGLTDVRVFECMRSGPAGTASVSIKDSKDIV